MQLNKKQPKNFLDIIPRRNIKEFSEYDGKITLLVPKFKSEIFRKWLIPKHKSSTMKIHLDEMGSHIWRIIKDEVTVEDLCKLLKNQLEHDVAIPDQLDEKVIKFLTVLYQQKLINFVK